MVEVIFGVRQGDLNYFVASQPIEVGIPSTRWLETYAVAEAKSFRHISRQAPYDSWHCKCPQLLSWIQMGVDPLVSEFTVHSRTLLLMNLLDID